MYHPLGGGRVFPAVTTGRRSGCHRRPRDTRPPPRTLYIRYYTGCTTAWAAGGYPAGTCGNLTEGPAYPRAAWANSLAAAERTQIEAMWYGYYAALSSANDALVAIRVKLKDQVPGAPMVETMATLTQGLALSG